MAFLFFSRSRATKAYGVIDLSGSSVAYAGVATKVEGGVSCPVISGGIRLKNVKSAFDLNRFSVSNERMLKSILEQRPAGSLIPDHYYCFLPSIFYLSQSRIINYQPEKGTVRVTERLINDIVSAEAEKFRQSIGGDTSTQVIDNRIMSIKLNGYDVEQPFNMEAHSLQITQYVAIAPEQTLKRISESIIAATHCNKIQFHSSQLAIFSTIRDVVGDKNFIIFDISGELTDITVVVQGVIIETATFPLGKNHLVRKLATKAGGVQAALSLLKMLDSDHLDNKNGASESLERARDQWIKACADTLALLSKRTLIPENFYLISDDTNTNLYAGWLTDPQVTGHTLANKTAKVSVVGPHFFSGFCQSSEQADHILMAESLFCDKLEQNKK